MILFFIFFGIRSNSGLFGTVGSYGGVVLNVFPTKLHVLSKYKL